MSLDKRSIELGTEGWGVKEDNLLAFRKDRTRYVEKPFTFSRGTAATRVNSSGSVEILHDEATNLLLHSNQFDTTWLDTGSEVSSGFVGYDGSSDAWKLNENTESTVHFLLQSVSVTGANTFSIYLKAGTKNKVMLYDGTNNRSARFNLETKSMHSTDGSGFINYNIEELNDGWARYSITGATSSSSFRLYLLDDSYGIAYTGDSANYIYIQDAQLETGYVATPYIETTTQAVTQPNKHETPRISYDIVDGVVSDKPHLLLEPARTNLVTYSENFEATDWIDQSIDTTLELVSSGAPNGGAFYRCTSGASGGGRIVDVFTGSMSGGVFSLYAKGSGSLTIDLYITGGSNITETITLTSEWTRYDVYNSRVDSGGDVSIRFHPNAIADIFGAQLEQGSYATSYIPNHGNPSGVTRAAETANNCGAAQDFNDDEGVLFAEILGTGDNQHPSNIYNFVSINNGLNNHNIVAIGYREDTKKFFIVVRGGNTTSFVEQNLDFEFNKYYRIALKYKSGNSSIFINGDKINDYTQTFSITGLTKLSFDYGGVDYTAAGLKTKEIKVYTETLNDAELRLLTKYAPKDYDAAFTADYVDNLAEFTVLRTEATDKLYYSISDGTNSVSGSATITATEVTISNIDISSLNDGTLTLSVYIEDERKQRGVTVTDTTIKDTTNTPLYSYALQQRATGATFEDLDNSESIIESLNVEV